MTEDIIHLDFTDDPPKSEQQLKIDALVGDVRHRAKEMARGAQNLQDYTKAFLLDYRYGHYDGLAWMFDQDPQGVTLNELVEDFDTAEAKTDLEKTAKAIEEMKAVLDGAPNKEGFAKVTVKKIRDGDFVLGYRVLADFPDGVFIPHSGFDEEAANYNNGPQTIYYEPNAACFRNAFSDSNAESLKNQGAESKVYYLPVMDNMEAQRSIKVGANGVAEYILGKDEQGNKIKQKMDSYLWVALVRNAHNEDKHFRVSDFWKRSNTK